VNTPPKESAVYLIVSNATEESEIVRLRLTKIDEYQFLTCLKHGLWGSKSARFKNWSQGDRLAIIVEKTWRHSRRFQVSHLIHETRFGTTVFSLTVSRCALRTFLNQRIDRLFLARYAPP
jgi:hypothetical protein